MVIERDNNNLIYYKWSHKWYEDMEKHYSDKRKIYRRKKI
jgi:hypothetical protein